MRRGRKCLSFCDGLRARRFSFSRTQTRGARRHPGDRKTGARRSGRSTSRSSPHLVAAAWGSCRMVHENLMKREFAEPARTYLKKRGITAGIAKRWQLGYAPEEWDAFRSWARGRGYNARDLIASGLVKTKDDADGMPGHTSYDRFRGRIMFPICNDIGEVIAFSGRLLKDEDGAAKYLNSPETPLFRK